MNSYIYFKNFGKKGKIKMEQEQEKNNIHSNIKCSGREFSNLQV